MEEHEIIIVYWQRKTMPRLLSISPVKPAISQPKGLAKEV
jgi:hypothetical protein